MASPTTSTMLGSMRPHHRAQLATAVARFLADIRRLARTKLRSERDRLLTAIDPSRAPEATSNPRQLARERPQTAGRRPRVATAEPTRRPATAARRARKPGVAAEPPEQRVPEPSAARPAAPRRTRSPSAPPRTHARVAAVEIGPAPTGPEAARTKAASASTPPGVAVTTIAAPASAAPTIEASANSAVATSAADVNSPAEAPKLPDHEELHKSGRRRGTVKWFSDAKGYGFIRGDDSIDVFVHYSAIASAGFRTLVQGQAVEYEVQQSAKGLQAVSVTHPGTSSARSAWPAGAVASSAPRP